MSYKSWGGVTLLFSALALAAGIAVQAEPAVAGSRKAIDVHGQLNYEVFRGAEAQDQSVRVTYSPGGTGAAALVLARVTNVAIDGTCNSACAWAFVRSNSACFTPRASFGFHAAHDPGTGRRLDAATGYWIASARPALRGRLSGLLSSSSLIVLSSSEMRKFYGDRACGASHVDGEVALKSAESQTTEVEQTAAAWPATVANETTAGPADIWNEPFARAIRIETITLEAFAASSAAASSAHVLNFMERPALIANDEIEQAASASVAPPGEDNVRFPVSGLVLTADEKGTCEWEASNAEQTAPANLL